MRKNMLILLVSFFALQLSAQNTTARGVVKDSGTGEPVPAVKITLLQQNISTQTNANGEFYFAFLESGSDEIGLSKTGYFPQILMVSIVENTENNLGEYRLRADVQADAKQDIILQLSEAQLDDDGAIQSAAGTLSSNTDVYISQTSYNFSPMRFQMRGYDNKYESTYINGVRSVDAERGGFSYSSLGGLNNATRNRDVVYGLAPTAFSYGNLGSSTNINTRASSFATGSNANLAASNRSYILRGQYTYGTGLLPSGWAFAVSGVVRWANKGIVEGTFYNSAGLFLSAEKVFNEKHSLSLVAFGAPTRRAQQAAVTQEAFDLAGSIYYNPYWGYQDGEIRNSRIVKSFDPTAVLSHEWKIDQKQRLRTGVSYHYSMYSNSALNFYNTLDPRPDYYRNMPSYQKSLGNDSLANVIADEWKNDKSARQINWDDIYKRNYQNNSEKPNENTRYILERRHNDLMEIALNSTYTNQIWNNWKLTAGIEARTSKGMHYKTLEDFLGGKLWYDIDPFAERDAPADSELRENDLNNVGRKVEEGDRFGYDYDIHVLKGGAFVLSEWSFGKVDLSVGLQGEYTQFYRYGNMRNGRAPENSYGKGEVSNFFDPSAKVGFTYKIDGRNRIYANVLAETNAPLPREAYISDRIKDDLVPNLSREKILSYDLNYSFIYPFLRGRVSAFRTHVNDGLKKTSYYSSEYNTFLHHALYDVNKIFQGIEYGISVPINSSFTFSTAGTFSDYRYVKDAMGILSWENGLVPEENIEVTEKPERVAIKNLKVSNGPQLALNATLSYFHSKMWFVDLSLNYYDNNYLDFSSNNRRETNMDLYTTKEIYDALGAQEKLKGGFMLDASIGKIIYLKNRQSLNFNLSLSNILNNTKMITGGYQQARLPSTINERSLDLFPNKYYYAWGFNFFFHVGYRF